MRERRMPVETTSCEEVSHDFLVGSPSLRRVLAAIRNITWQKVTNL